MFGSPKEPPDKRNPHKGQPQRSSDLVLTSAHNGIEGLASADTRQSQHSRLSALGFWAAPNLPSGSNVRGRFTWGSPRRERLQDPCYVLMWKHESLFIGILDLRMLGLLKSPINPF